MQTGFESQHTKPDKLMSPAQTRPVWQPSPVVPKAADTPWADGRVSGQPSRVTRWSLAAVTTVASVL